MYSEVTLFNVHKVRDRSHYERFASYHGSFYRGVEATSVTPFSPRALDPELATLPRVHRKFRANRSMRDAEPEVNLWMRTLDNFDVEGAGEDEP